MENYKTQKAKAQNTENFISCFLEGKKYKQLENISSIEKHQLLLIITFNKNTQYVIMPAYSIGKEPKKASFVRASDVPGVGSYSSNERLSSKVMRGPTFVIGRSARLKTDKPFGPGPDKYDATQNSFFADKSKGYHITGKTRQRIRSEGPGPANYSIPKIFPSKHFSFGMRTQIIKKNNDQGPGPADYQVNTIKRAHAISFQQSKRPSVEVSPRYMRPGPGQYEGNGLRETKNKFAFPKRQKFLQQSLQQKEKERIPGPGSYSNMNINSIKKQIIAARFGKTKRDFLYGDPKIPGPGAYSPTNSQKNRSPIATIGNSPKGMKITNKNPGPASYNIAQLESIKRKQPSAIFGKTQRSQSNNQIDIKTGPGSYNIDYHDRGHAFSITGRNSKEKANLSPGPLDYNPKYDSQFRKTEMGVIGKDRKMMDEKVTSPGPGTYNFEDISNKSRTFYFPKQVRKQAISAVPGPGTYQIKPIIGSDVPQSNRK